MNSGEHLTTEGLNKIVSMRASLNLGLSDKLVSAFPDITPVQRPTVESIMIQDPNWLAGFVSGDGSFMVTMGKSLSTNSGYQVGLRFSIGQNSRELQLLESFISYLGCGAVYSYPAKSIIEFKVTKTSDFNKIIVPFFLKYPIQGLKPLTLKTFVLLLY